MLEPGSVEAYFNWRLLHPAKDAELTLDAYSGGHSELLGYIRWCAMQREEAKQVVAFVRSGGAYVKPVRTVCKYGHDIRGSRAYDYGKGKMCKRCQSKRSHEYYVRKTKQKVDSNDVKSSR